MNRPNSLLDTPMTALGSRLEHGHGLCLLLLLAIFCSACTVADIPYDGTNSGTTAEATHALSTASFTINSPNPRRVVRVTDADYDPDEESLLVGGHISGLPVSDWPADYVILVNGHPATVLPRDTPGSFAWSDRLALGRPNPYWSDETYRIVGLEPDGSMTLERSLQLYAPGDRSRIEALYLDAIRNKHSLNFTTHVVRSGGDLRQIRVMSEFVEEPNGDQIVMIGTIHDVTDKLRAMSDLHYAAAHDSLTGLLNRNAFEEGARERLRQALIADASFFALLFDLTGFKFVNDTFGHQTGDKLLQQIGARIAKAAPDQAIVSRWGGDEFAVLSPLAMSESQARTLGQNILKAIATAVDLEEGLVGVGATCGIAQSTTLSSLEDLIRRAGLALYHGKAREPGRLHFYNPGMELRNSERRIALETVESALGEDRVQAGYQPIIQLTDNRLIGFEALLRIHGNGRSVIPAGDVIPAIVDPIISRQISERMFENVSRDLPGLMADHAGVQYVSINAAEADLISRDFASRVLRVLEQHGVDPTCVTVEITETMLLVGNNQNVKSVLEELRSHGIRIALDDFGTGYSSLTHLRDFPIDRLKIDASFVQDICFSPTSKNIVQAMVVMGRSMGIEVIAEGIEAEEQRSALLDIGCYYGQGYLFSPAVPAEKARAFQFGYSDRETA